eukprot:scaffold397760_cov44-Prasinocladus_malaysianus.AAC.1
MFNLIDELEGLTGDDITFISRLAPYSPCGRLMPGGSKQAIGSDHIACMIVIIYCHHQPTVNHAMIRMQ